MKLNNSFIFVANWKIILPATKAIYFCKNNSRELAELSLASRLVICPSFPVLLPIIEILKQTNVNVGAQNCSRYKEGAYTGEVSSKSLAEIGCTYCIVGHSERRHYFGETDEDVAQKTERLIENNVQSIICVGETNQEYEEKKTFQVLERQLIPICHIISQSTPVIIAYEPVWAIGTGIVPDKDYLNTVFSWLFSFMQKRIENNKIQFLYGGSVSKNNIRLLKEVPFVDGFLIGRSSTDFQMFKKIVSS